MLGSIQLSPSQGTSLCMESSTWHWQGWRRQYPKDLILPEVCLEGLLSGWQENDISHNPKQLISVCPALRISAGAAENAQVKHSVCKSQPCTTWCSCALSVQLHKTAKLFREGRNISGNPASSMAWELVWGAAVCVTTCSSGAFNYFFFS